MWVKLRGYLNLAEPVHGVRPFQYVHIDHTQLDVLLVGAESRKVLGKPWLTLAVDAESREIAGFYLSFEAPSYRSCMMVVRDMVRRYGQMPAMLVLDNGKEFHSRALSRVCELYGCSLRYRPGGKPRYGSVMERMFGTTNTQFIHQLEGNTQLMKAARSVTKAVLPENFAAWTLAHFHGALEQFFNLYGSTLHPAHGEAFNLTSKKPMNDWNVFLSKAQTLDGLLAGDTDHGPAIVLEKDEATWGLLPFGPANWIRIQCSGRQAEVPSLGYQLLSTEEAGAWLESLGPCRIRKGRELAKQAKWNRVKP